MKPADLALRPFGLRLLMHGLPTAVLLAFCGYFMASAAGSIIATERDNGENLAESLRLRLPLTLAAWGFAFIFICELFRSWWGTKQQALAAAPVKTEVNAEQLLAQLLELADEAERQRSTSVTLQTPPPRGEPLPFPDLAELPKTRG